MDNARGSRSMIDMKSARSSRSTADMRSARSSRSRPDMRSARSSRSRPDMRSARSSRSRPDMNSARSSRSRPDMNSARSSRSRPDLGSARGSRSIVDMNSARSSRSTPDLRSARGSRSIVDMKSARSSRSTPDMRSAKGTKKKKKRRRKSKSRKDGGKSLAANKRRRVIAGILCVLIAIFLLALAVGGPIYVLFYKKNGDREGVKLITAVVLFRHGARAPVDIGRNATTEALFPNGAGQLTQIGIDDTFLLGQFLGKRYVQSGFLKSPPLPSQFYFKSKANDRCLMSGALVASGMWANPDDLRFTAVPIFSQEKNDRILTHLQNCELEAKRLSDRCGLTPPSPKEWSLYEGFVFECIGLKKTTKLFKNAKDFSRVDGLVQQDRNFMAMTPWFEKHRDEIYDLYQKTYNFIVGVSYYHDKEKLQLKQGLLMKQILAILKKRWKDWDKNLEIPNPKFIAYSTQDWMVMAFLDALGCGKLALSGTIPGYNSLVVIELVDRDGDPFIWVYFKDNSMDSLKDLTKDVRGCNSSPCPLEKFLKCCNDYVTDDPKQVCGQQS